jgi:hypothetical protein
MDNSDPHVLATVNGFRGDRGEKPIIFFVTDPGMTPPIDICWNCWFEIFDCQGGDVEHPPYDEDDERRCALCLDRLTYDDD